MTEDQFRSNPEMTKRFRELITDPVMQQAIVIWKDGSPPVEPPIMSDAIASVRMLSQMVGADAAMNRFLNFGEPKAPEVEEPPPDWGAKIEPEMT